MGVGRRDVPAATPLVPLGFSQGGFMALQMLRTRPERMAATVVLSGLVWDVEQPADALIAESRPPVFWGRGEADTVIWPAMIERITAWLPGHATLTERVYPGLAHGISEQECATRESSSGPTCKPLLRLPRDGRVDERTAPEPALVDQTQVGRPHRVHACVYARLELARVLREAR